MTKLTASIDFGIIKNATINNTAAFLRKSLDFVAKNRS